ncbi:MAG: hypothetical protein AABW88_00125 [Nanoarchaeota archaeon]
MNEIIKDFIVRGFPKFITETRYLISALAKAESILKVCAERGDVDAKKYFEEVKTKDERSIGKTKLTIKNLPVKIERQCDFI